MSFDLRLWQLTRGMRWRIVATVLIGLLAAVVGVSRFVFLGLLIALVYRGAPAAALIWPAVAVAAIVLIRAFLDHERTMVAHRTAARVQEELRGRLYDKIAELGPAWFAGERTGGVMLSVVDGVEQLQSFFGQYVPQALGRGADARSRSSPLSCGGTCRSRGDAGRGAGDADRAGGRSTRSSGAPAWRGSRR